MATEGDEELVRVGRKKYRKVTQTSAYAEAPCAGCAGQFKDDLCFALPPCRAAGVDYIYVTEVKK